jgi:hypothetical protein
MGDKVQGVRITGDPRRAEVETFRVAFPWGFVDVTRATDGDPGADYWVHLFVNNPTGVNYCPDEDSGEFSSPGAIKDARLDLTGKHAGASNVGDFGSPDLYHLAVRVGRSSNGG